MTVYNYLLKKKESGELSTFARKMRADEKHAEQHGLEYNLDMAAQYLRDRIEIFRAKTKTNYAIVQTMVTTYGVAEGINSGVVQQEVTMDDLFV